MIARPPLLPRRGWAAAALVLAACHAAPEDPRAVTPDEQAQLNDAAEMLDANSVSADALVNEEAP